MRPFAPKSRLGFTLIELLVVIALILVLATLALLIMPRLSDDQRAVRTSDQISMWLLIAKQRAYRDQAPRGVRLIQSPLDPTQVKEMMYVERPEDWTGAGLVVPAPVPMPPVTPPATVVAGTSGFILYKDLTNGNNAVTPTNLQFVLNPTVEPGDYLVFDSLEISPYNSHRIAALYYVPPSGPNSIWGTYLVFASESGKPSVINAGFPLPMAPTTAGTPPAPGNNYPFRIVRRERPLTGEAILQLPRDMIVDLTTDTPDANGGIQGFSQLPGGSLDIVFNQRGQLMGANSVNGKVILRVRNGSKALDQGDQLLVVVYGRTGLIAVQPLDLTPSASGQPGYYADPFSFTKDGKASGL